MVGVRRPRAIRALGLLAVAGLAFIAVPQPTEAREGSRDFELAYRAYERELAGRHFAAAIPYAEQALNIAQSGTGFKDELIHKLTANLGKMYFLIGRWNDAARAFDRYLAANRRPEGSMDEYLAVLLQAGTAKRELGRANQALPLFQRALRHLDRGDKKRRPARADTLYQLTLVLMDLKQADKALETGQEAYELYDDLYGRKDVRTLEAGLTLARTEVVLLKNNQAHNHLKYLARSLHDNEALRDWQKSGLHGRIAALYEKMNAKPLAERHRNMANAFLRGIGDVELELRSGEPPDYPRRAEETGVEGMVEVEFTVRKDGRTDDVRIIRSSPPGVFDGAVKKAVKKWRYKPPRQKGERVDYPGVRQSIEFRVPD